MALRGRIDEVTPHGYIRGWAADFDSADPTVKLEIHVDGQLVTTLRAADFRPDLEDAFGDGHHAFAVQLPASRLDGASHSVSAVRHGSREVIGYPVTCVLRTAPSEAAPAQEARVAAPSREPAARPNFLRTDVPWEQLGELAAQRRRLALLAGYHPAGDIAPYHQALGRALSATGLAVAFLQNVDRPLPDTAMPPRDTAFDLRASRSNVGYDFGAWFDALEKLEPVLPRLEQLVLLNDSVFGPLFPLEDAFREMSGRTSPSGRPVDAWGMTDSWQHGYHLQSYWLVLNGRALQSKSFTDFRRAFPRNLSKERVIEEGELKLTRALLAEGLEVAALCPYEAVAGAWLRDVPTRLREVMERPEIRAVSEAVPGAFGSTFTRDYPGGELHHYLATARAVRQGQPVNPTHYFWRTLMTQFHCPFLKRELLFRNPCNIPDLFEVQEVLTSVSDYPTALIDDYRGLGGSQTAPPAGLARPTRATVPALRPASRA